MLKRLLAILAMSVTAMPCVAATLAVPAQHPNIQSAITAAEPGDLVLVSPGTYWEVLNFGGKSLTLRSAAGAAATVIRAPASGSAGVITLPPGSDATTVIDGFTIDGAGLLNGVHCQQSNPLVTRCVIENCRGGYDGGGVWLQHCAARLIDNVIRNSTTPISGGGVFVRMGTDWGSVEIIGNEIYGNTAGNAGGIACIEGAGAVIERNVIHHNGVSPYQTAAIGAVFIRGDHCRLRNNTVADNDGGISIAMSIDTDVRNNIIVRNERGGLIVNPYVGAPVGLVYAYNDIWGNLAGDYVQTLPGALDISADPLFAGGNGSEGYTLAAGSPGIDAGDPDPAFADPDGSRNDLGAIPYTPPPPPRTLRVPRDFASIQAAIDAANHGDRIVVWPGTYRERLDFRGKTLALVARQGWQSTRIAPPRLAADSRELWSERLSEDGQPSRDGWQGALISLPPGSGSATLIEGFALDGEQSHEGIHCRGSHPTIKDCVVEHCVGAYDGGGMWFEHCAPTVEGCVLRYNRTPISGGGIFIRLGIGHGQARFLDNQIHGNVAGNAGGIICIEGEGALIERNRVWDNHVDPPETQVWGAVAIRADNCLVRNNTISFNDGGITVIGSVDVDLRNNIVTSNLAGGLIVNDYWGYTQNLTHDYNDVWDNAGGDYLATDAAAHEFSLDPRFRSPHRRSAKVEFALRHDSPCVDAGDPDPSFNDSDGSRCDMGAVPRRPSWPPRGYDDVGAPLRNAPNPFNPVTTISFDLPADCRVRLCVYDIRGQLVRRLLDADLPLGSHSAIWDGKDGSGRALASGTYLARLRAGSTVETLRMELLK